MSLGDYPPEFVAALRDEFRGVDDAPPVYVERLYKIWMAAQAAERRKQLVEVGEGLVVRAVSPGAWDVHPRLEEGRFASVRKHDGRCYSVWYDPPDPAMVAQTSRYLTWDDAMEAVAHTYRVNRAKRLTEAV